MTFYYNKRWVNASGSTVIDSTTSTGLTFSGTTNLTNTSLINITDSSSNIICAWNNQSNTTLFSSPAFMLGTSSELSATFGKIMMVTMAGLTVAFPFMGVGMLFFNDIFGLMVPSDVFSWAVVAIGISFLLNSFSEKSLKNIGFYFAIVLAAWTYMYTTGTNNGATNITNPDTDTGLQSSISAISTAITTADIGGFFVGAITFILALGIFVIQLPLKVSSLFYSSLYLVNPTLAGAAAGMSAVISLGMGLWILVKFYEVAANRFRNI